MEDFMKLETRQNLQAVYIQCMEEDRSIEYTIQLMQDMVKVNHECVMNFLYDNRDKSKDGK
jgi:glutathionylspermidine synthase